MQNQFSLETRDYMLDGNKIQQIMNVAFFPLLLLLANQCTPNPDTSCLISLSDEDSDWNMKPHFREVFLNTTCISELNIMCAYSAYYKLSRGAIFIIHSQEHSINFAPVGKHLNM